MTREHRLAIALIALTCAAWVFATPVGWSGTGDSGYQWHLRAFDPGDGSPVRVRGAVVDRVHMFGAPDGPLRRREVRWSAEVVHRKDAPPGYDLVPIPVSPALQAEVLRRFPDAVSGAEGWHVHPPALLGSAVLGALFFLVTAGWWVAVRTRPMEPRRARAAVSTLSLAMWPWLLGTGLSWFLWEQAGRPDPGTPRLLDRYAMLSATALLVSVGLVLALRPRVGAEASA